MNIYISLSDTNFDDLVRGEQIEIKDRKGHVVKIILKDIGFENMLHCVTQAKREQEDDD